MHPRGSPLGNVRRAHAQTSRTIACVLKTSRYRNSGGSSLKMPKRHVSWQDRASAKRAWFAQASCQVATHWWYFTTPAGARSGLRSAETAHLNAAQVIEKRKWDRVKRKQRKDSLKAFVINIGEHLYSSTSELAPHLHKEKNSWLASGLSQAQLRSERVKLSTDVRFCWLIRTRDHHVWYGHGRRHLQVMSALFFISSWRHCYGESLLRVLKFYKQKSQLVLNCRKIWMGQATEVSIR